MQHLIDLTPGDWKSLTHRMTWWYRHGALSHRFPALAHQYKIGPGTTAEEWAEMRYEVTLARRAKAARLTRAKQKAKDEERRAYMRDYMVNYRKRKREAASGAH